MRIINNADKRVEFASIKVGDCFFYDNCLFIKMLHLEKCGYSANAYCFVDNTIACVPQSMLVTPVDAEIVVRSKGVD